MSNYTILQAQSGTITISTPEGKVHVFNHAKGNFDYANDIINSKFAATPNAVFSQEHINAVAEYIIDNQPKMVQNESKGDNVTNTQEALNFLEEIGIERIDGKFNIAGQELSNDSPLIGVVLSLLIDVNEDFEPKKNFLKKILDSHFSIDQITQICNFMLGRGNEGTNQYNLTDEGNFLLYRSVKDSGDGTYWDHHTGNIPQIVGYTYEMPQVYVDKDPDNTCSHGLHVATLCYAEDFGWNNAIQLVEVDPRDVMSVPTDYNFTKVRTTKYKVLGFMDEDKTFFESLMINSLNGQKRVSSTEKFISVGQHGKILKYSTGE